ncbi:MAG: insulinase family protein [Parachlamydiaceae bacterium]|nr:insulinase family protein [Parachlamydiaceae bacterium]
MKILSIPKKVVLSLSMFLTAFCPLAQSYATIAPSAMDSESSENESPSERLTMDTDRLTNGLTYTLVSTKTMKDITSVKLAVGFAQDPNEKALSLLMQHAMFYGTEKLSRQEIVTQLDSMGLDINANTFVNIGEAEQSILFYFSKNEEQNINKILSFIQQLAFEPSFTNENVELARIHLIDSLVTNDQEETEAQALLKKQILNVTAAEIKTFHKKWYRSDLTHLFIIGNEFESNLSTTIANVFGAIKTDENIVTDTDVRLAQLTNENTVEDTLSTPTDSLADKIDFLSDKNCYVVDGKIWMKEPNWINKSSNGRILGVVLTVIGIGGMIVAAPITVALVAPIAVIAGGVSTVSGIYLMSSSYLKDPTYIEAKRQEDLKNGFEYAYRYQRAGITLTPFERRGIFLQEMTVRFEMLPKLPMLLLADNYEINDPIFTNILAQDEHNYLYTIKKEFIKQRNQYKLLIENLEKELVEATKPYAYARDIGLNYAKDIYNQNYFVLFYRSLKATYEQNIEKIEKALTDKKITVEERDNYLAQEKVLFEAAVKSSELQTGLAIANEALNRMEAEFQHTYQFQIQACKQSIRYEQRKAVYARGKEALVYEFDEQLRASLSHFPVYVTSLPDYIDLR